MIVTFNIYIYIYWHIAFYLFNGWQPWMLLVLPHVIIVCVSCRKRLLLRWMAAYKHTHVRKQARMRGGCTISLHVTYVQIVFVYGQFCFSLSIGDYCCHDRSWGQDVDCCNSVQLSCTMYPWPTVRFSFWSF